MTYRISQQLPQNTQISKTSMWLWCKQVSIVHHDYFKITWKHRSKNTCSFIFFLMKSTIDPWKLTTSPLKNDGKKLEKTEKNTCGFEVNRHHRRLQAFRKASEALLMRLGDTDRLIHIIHTFIHTYMQIHVYITTPLMGGEGQNVTVHFNVCKTSRLENW